jgi:pSer/pThr/pTyr-binding forkhead associated (FHA) protein
MATLFLASGPHEGAYFPIQRKSLVVGRDEGLLAQVVDDKVSRKHFSIVFDAASESYSVIDLKSKNGVFINDQKVTGETRLKDDDLIRIGNTLLLFTYSDFRNENSALAFFRVRGQRERQTILGTTSSEPHPKRSKT